MFERIIPLIKEENLIKIQKTKIILIGVGGVGGTALETLVRSGFQNLTIIDHDIFEESNLNRQIMMLKKDINRPKVKVARERMESINENVIIDDLEIFLNKENISILSNFDYVIDACDTVDTKIEIIKYCKEHKINVISSMGMGNRLKPNLIEITKLSKTENDPLAKVMRSRLRKENVDLNIIVAASKELPIKSDKISSLMPVPSVAGILIADYIINDITKKV